MIEKNIIFDDLSDVAAVWCDATIDSGELARVAGVIMDRNISFVSVVPECVRIIWPWLENKGVKILSRFVLPDKKVTEQQISDVTMAINTAFKHGAHGAQIFLPYGALGELVEQTHVIRDDLFFNKDLSIAIDINQIDSSDWENLFETVMQEEQKVNMIEGTYLGKYVQSQEDVIRCDISNEHYVVVPFSRFENINITPNTKVRFHVFNINEKKFAVNVNKIQDLEIILDIEEHNLPDNRIMKGIIKSLERKICEGIIETIDTHESYKIIFNNRIVESDLKVDDMVKFQLEIIGNQLYASNVQKMFESE